MNLEEIKARVNNDSYRTLHEAETDIEWLIAEVERLESQLDLEKRLRIQQYEAPCSTWGACLYCGNPLEEVRPGKQQCGFCLRKE